MPRLEDYGPRSGILDRSSEVTSIGVIATAYPVLAGPHSLMPVVDHAVFLGVGSDSKHIASLGVDAPGTIRLYAFGIFYTLKAFRVVLKVVKWPSCIAIGAVVGRPSRLVPLTSFNKVLCH